jgi:membrane dipeptidase
MDRRRILAYAAAAGFGSMLGPRAARSQTTVHRFADMHTHLGFRQEASIREAMARGPMLLVAEKITPDGPLLHRVRGRLGLAREAKPGELRRNFESGLKRRLARLRAERLGIVASGQDLEQTLATGTPAVVLAAEGADFLEGELGYLDVIRAQGLVHLQLVHYYVPSLIGDISTEPATHGGLTAFGKSLVKACNRLGILVDVAHCTTEGIEQALTESSRPIIYSHGQMSENAPHASQSGVAARSIYAPLARRIADRGGVVGLWPLWSEFAHLDLYADQIVAMTKRLGADHVGVGTDMFGLPRSVIPSYAEYAQLPDVLAKRGLKPAEIEALLGGNYIRVLRQAISV